MKNIFLTLTAFVGLLLTSCGEKSEIKVGDYPLEIEGSINGPFSESFEVTNAVLKISDQAFGTKLLVEVKRTSDILPVNVDDTDLCGTSSGKSTEWCLSADILGESNLPIMTNLDIYGRDPFVKALTLKENETIWLEFSVGYGDELEKEPLKAKRIKLTSSTKQNEVSSLSVSKSEEVSKESNEDWDAYLKSYEKYIDQYVSLMKKAQSGDMSVMLEYAEMLENIEELQGKMDVVKGELSASQLAKFTKLQYKMVEGMQNLK